MFLCVIFVIYSMCADHSVSSRLWDFSLRVEQWLQHRWQLISSSLSSHYSPMLSFLNSQGVFLHTLNYFSLKPVSSDKWIDSLYTFSVSQRVLFKHFSHILRNWLITLFSLFWALYRKSPIFFFKSSLTVSGSLYRHLVLRLFFGFFLEFP